KDERFLLRPAGSGGYGPPWERPAERVADDVLDGYVTVEGALRDYGVAVDAAGTIDVAATAAARARLAAAPPPPGADEICDRGSWSYGDVTWPPHSGARGS